MKRFLPTLLCVAGAWHSAVAQTPAQAPAPMPSIDASIVVCKEDVMADPQMSAALTRADLGLAPFCQCVAMMQVSAYSEQEWNAWAQAHGVRTQNRRQQAEQFCLSAVPKS